MIRWRPHDFSLCCCLNLFIFIYFEKFRCSSTLCVVCVYMQHNNLWIHGRDLLQVNFHYVTIMNHYSCTQQQQSRVRDICILLNENSTNFQFFVFHFPALIIEIVMWDALKHLSRIISKIFAHIIWKEFFIIDLLFILYHKVFARKNISSWILCSLA